jgi:hypothetical protein
MTYDNSDAGFIWPVSKVMLLPGDVKSKQSGCKIDAGTSPVPALRVWRVLTRPTEESNFTRDEK